MSRSAWYAAANWSIIDVCGWYASTDVAIIRYIRQEMFSEPILVAPVMHPTHWTSMHSELHGY